jgi:hypothetical protein
VECPEVVRLGMSTRLSWGSVVRIFTKNNNKNTTGLDGRDVYAMKQV